MNEKDLLLVKSLLEIKLLKKELNRKKKLKSDCNKRYYLKHRDMILSKNKEMRSIYKLVKQNSI